MDKENLREYFDDIASQRDYSYKKNDFYHNQLYRLFSKYIPYGKSILEIGCTTGNLLASLKTFRGLSIDISPKMIDLAWKN